jgi:hypothetical protein
MNCIGDKIARDEDGNEMYDTSAECYRIQGCPGCEKCYVKCTGCDSCEAKQKKLREPGPGDFVVIKPPILSMDSKCNWSKGMDLAIGRTAYIHKGDRVMGYKLKFTTTSKEILDQYLYPVEALRLAMVEDLAADKFIKNTQMGNDEM